VLEMHALSNAAPPTCRYSDEDFYQPVKPVTCPYCRFQPHSPNFPFWGSTMPPTPRGMHAFLRGPFTGTMR